MDELLTYREKIISIFKKYEIIILNVLKFLVGFFVFYKIFSINMFSETFTPYINTTTITLSSIFCGLFILVMPASLSFLLTSLVTSFALSKSVEVAVIVLVFLLLILIFYVHLAPKESYFIIFTILAFYFKIPYLVPIVAGLYFSAATIFPISVGVFIWRSIPTLQSAIDANTSSITNVLDVFSVPQKLFTVFGFIVKGVVSNQLWLSEALIFSLVVFLIFVVSKLSFDYSKDIAIIIGGLLNIVGFLIVIIVMNLNISVLSVLVGSIVCIVLALLIRSFDHVLDYDKVENLEFSDDDFYYYVKAIPKVKIKVDTQELSPFKELISVKKKQREEKLKEKELIKERLDKNNADKDKLNKKKEDRKLEDKKLEDKNLVEIELINKNDDKVKANDKNKDSKVDNKKKKKKFNNKKAAKTSKDDDNFKKEEDKNLVDKLNPDAIIDDIDTSQVVDKLSGNKDKKK